MEIIKYPFRNIGREDFAEVCKLPQNSLELFCIFPYANYPLTVNQLEEGLKVRECPTVFIDQDKVIGFVNFYQVIENDSCWLGNFIVETGYRNIGVGRYIVGVMEQQAIQLYNIKTMHLACFSDNMPALILYHKLGYIPYGMEIREDKNAVRRMLFKLKKEITKENQ